MATNHEHSTEHPHTPRPFRAADVLTGAIDHRQRPTRGRKQISAQLEPDQVRLLGELHARLNATADKRIEKSDLVGLGIELLGALLETAPSEKFDPASGDSALAEDESTIPTFRDTTELRAYLRTWIRGNQSDPSGKDLPVAQNYTVYRR